MAFCKCRAASDTKYKYHRNHPKRRILRRAAIPIIYLIITAVALVQRFAAHGATRNPGGQLNVATIFELWWLRAQSRRIRGLPFDGPWMVSSDCPRGFLCQIRLTVARYCWMVHLLYTVCTWIHLVGQFRARDGGQTETPSWFRLTCYSLLLYLQ